MDDALIARRLGLSGFEFGPPEAREHLVLLNLTLGLLHVPDANLEALTTAAAAPIAQPHHKPHAATPLPPPPPTHQTSTVDAFATLGSTHAFSAFEVSLGPHACTRFAEPDAPPPPPPAPPLLQQAPPRTLQAQLSPEPPISAAAQLAQPKQQPYQQYVQNALPPLPPPPPSQPPISHVTASAAPMPTLPESPLLFASQSDSVQAPAEL